MGSGYSVATGVTTTALIGGGTGITISIIGLTYGTYLAQDVSVIAGSAYEVKYTIKNRTTGSVFMQLGGVDGSIIGHYGLPGPLISDIITVATTGDLRFLGTTDFDGSITDVSVKLITPSSVLVELENSDDSSGIEMRSGGSSKYNTFLGYQSGQSDLAASTYNTGVGYQALKSISSGYQNAAVGSGALKSNTKGFSNTALGDLALNLNSVGHSNTALGTYVMEENTTGSQCVGIGRSSLRRNTQGFANVAVGYKTLAFNREGFRNTALGVNALFGNTLGNYNVSVGFDALVYVAVTSNNTALGSFAGCYIADGVTPLYSPVNSIYIGYDARGMDTDNNSIVIGYAATSLGPNIVVLGNDSIVETSLKGTILTRQPTPTAKTTATTLTIAELLTRIITGTHTAGATQNYILPTGTLCDAGIEMANNDSFEWTLINLSAAAIDTVTIVAGADHTVIGNMIVQSAHATTGALYGNSATFRTRKTATNTFVTYRIS